MFVNFLVDITVNFWMRILVDCITVRIWLVSGTWLVNLEGDFSVNYSVCDPVGWLPLGVHLVGRMNCLTWLSPFFKIVTPSMTWTQIGCWLLSWFTRLLNFGRLFVILFRTYLCWPTQLWESFVSGFRRTWTLLFFCLVLVDFACFIPFLHLLLSHSPTYSVNSLWPA